MTTEPKQTKTDIIFSTTCPYDHKSQGNAPRLLFVCSAGLLRSPTGAAHFATKGFNTRSCGTHEYALIPLSANLIMWADHIIFVERENYIMALAEFLNTGFDEDLTMKAIVLNIEDKHDYGTKEIKAMFDAQLFNVDLKSRSIIAPQIDPWSRGH